MYRRGCSAAFSVDSFAFPFIRRLYLDGAPASSLQDRRRKNGQDAVVNIFGGAVCNQKDTPRLAAGLERATPGNTDGQYGLCANWFGSPAAKMHLDDWLRPHRNDSLRPFLCFDRATL